MNKRDAEKIEELYKAVLALQNPVEAKRFFRDLLTENEIKEFANRWRAAKMLNKKAKYTDIAKETGLSSRTIARVAKWLTDGKNGYRLVLNRVQNHHTSFPPGKELS